MTCPYGPSVAVAAPIPTVSSRWRRESVRKLSRPAVRALALFSAVARIGGELIYQFEQPFVVDSSKFQQRFGGEATPYAAGIAQTIARYQGQTDRSRRTLPV